MSERKTPWWNPFASRGQDSHDSADGQRELIARAAKDLRELLSRERGRLRPDAWSTAIAMVGRTEELLPHWDGLAAQRTAAALTVEDAVCRHLPRRLEAFLAVPNSQKPVLADELAEQLRMLEEEHLRACRRLHAVSRIRLESLREIRSDDA
jgi:hypothetical protein